MSDTRESISRKLVLVDLENILFGAHQTASDLEVSDRSAAIRTLAEARRPTDQLIVGCNPHLAFAARAACPHARLVTRIGADGADSALIDQLDTRHAADRFTELCIVSGDHAFADVALEARRAGLSVRVIAPRFGLSLALRHHADLALMLPEAIDRARHDLAA